MVGRYLDEGWSVAGLVRENGTHSLPEAVDVVTGDINDVEALDRLTSGADVVIHTVSNFRTASGPPESYRQINVDGTRTTFEAAVRNGVKRFVHCSTIGVHGHVRSTPANETSDFNPGDLYQETKLEAEQFIQSRIGGDDIEIVVVRPCSMYGPGDLRMLKMFRMLAKGSFFKVGPCQENFHAIYIDDIVDGFFRASTVEGAVGETFIIGGDGYLSLDAYIDVAAAAVDSPPPRIRLPYWMLYSLAWLCEKVTVPFGIEPPLHIRRVRFFRNNRAFDTRKAVDMLGFSPKTQLEDGMRRTVDWYRDEGHLPKSGA